LANDIIWCSNGRAPKSSYCRYKHALNKSLHHCKIFH
jgi:hypothetical protein